MAATIDRRTVLAGFASVAGLAGSVANAAESSPPGSLALPAVEKPRFSAYPYGAQIWVRDGVENFTCYRAAPTQKYPYFYPLISPASRLPMTEESCEPWPHHRSLFIGCDRVNGQNFWQDSRERGQIVSVDEPKVAEADADHVVIADRCVWKPPDKPAVMEDERRFTISAPEPMVRLIDADITLIAAVDVHVMKTNHSLFSLRCARSLAPVGGGKLVNSQGQVGEKDTFGQKARWCGFEATRCGTPECIVLMDHPGNPWAPCTWFTRDYGNVSPTPMQWLGDDGWRLPEGDKVRLRYRVAVIGGAMEPDRVDALYQVFADRA